MVNETKAPAGGAVVKTLDDLPGVGPTKAKWLKAAGIKDLQAARDVPLEKLMHVRGIGRLLAVRIKEVLTGQETGSDATATTDAQASDLTEGQMQWQETVTEHQGSIMVLVSDLLAQPQKYGLKPKFMKDLERLGTVVDGLPVSTPPIDGTRRGKIVKHLKAIRVLLESAVKMDEDSDKHRKVVKEKLRDRRKKLERWT